jgi:hypothetical protein
MEEEACKVVFEPEDEEVWFVAFELGTFEAHYARLEACAMEWAMRGVNFHSGAWR